LSDQNETTPLDSETPAVPPDETSEKEAKRPVLTIHLYSWATPILGLVMLIVGLFAGYFTHPLISPLAVAPTKTTQATAAPKTTQDASNPSLKDVVVAQTRHFIGDVNAPVTIVEFSDFQ